MGPSQGVNRRSVALLIDSNTLIMMASGLIAPSMLGETLTSSYRLYITDAVARELERLAESHPRPTTRRLASLALRLASVLGASILATGEGDADDSLEAAARALRASGLRVVVATSDRSLRRRLRRLGVPTMYYRESEGRLEVDWEPV